jgi:hypothetical protein
MDSGNGRVRRMSLAGTFAVSNVAGTMANAMGFADGTGNDARFRGQLGLAADALGRLIVADTANYRLRVVIPGSNAGGTSVSTIAGSGQFGSRLGPGDTSDLVAPAGVAVRPDGTIAVTDSWNSSVRLVTR